MERTLCVWYPDWPLRRPDAPPDRPAQAVDETNRVIAINALARAADVTVGMRRREAEAICPTVVTFDADPGADSVRFEPMAVVIEELIPRVEVVMPGLVFAPLDGALTYYGGEGPLIDRVEKELAAVSGPGFRLGVGDGPFAARRAADLATDESPVYRVTDDAAFLASLDIGVLGREEMAATFRWLGITTLGELSALPRAAVVSRFGSEGLDAHRLARGEDRATRPRPLPPDLAVIEEYSPPLENLEQAGFAARMLANRLLVELAAHGVAPHRVEVEATAADGAVRTRTWRSADPFDDGTLADRIRWQLQAWLDHARRDSGPGIRGGLVRLRLAPADVSDEGRQLALHEDAHSAAEAQRSLSQAQAILGPDRVLRPRRQGGRDPRERVDWHRWGEMATAPARDPDAPWPGTVPSPSPTLVPDEPMTLEVEWDAGMPVSVRLGARWVPVLSWAGPWRHVGRWWEGAGPLDRYQLVTSAGAFLCEVRNGRTVITGIYD